MIGATADMLIGRAGFFTPAICTCPVDSIALARCTSEIYKGAPTAGAFVPPPHSWAVAGRRWTNRTTSTPTSSIKNYLFLRGLKGRALIFKKYLESVVAFGLAELSSLTAPYPPKNRVHLFLVERWASGDQVVHERTVKKKNICHVEMVVVNVVKTSSLP